MADVFLSYKREDRRHAQLLAERLEQYGFEVWWDFELLSGDRYRRVIERVIDECAAAVVIWSKRARESAFVIDEANYANGQDKLCPVRIEDCQPPLGFGQLHVNDLIGWEGHEDHPDFQALLRGLEAKTGKTAKRGENPRTSDGEALAAELEAFKSAQAAGSEAALRAFVAAHPEGVFSSFVRDQLKAKSGSTPQPAARRFDPQRSVFLSYPTDIDGALLRAVVHELQSRELSIWLYDPAPYGFSREELAMLRWQRSGGSWKGQTRAAIREAACVVALVNTHSLTNRFQRDEFKWAVAQRKLIPAIVGDVAFNSLPSFFRDTHTPTITGEMLSTDLGRNRLAMLATDAEAMVSVRQRQGRRGRRWALFRTDSSD